MTHAELTKIFSERFKTLVDMRLPVMTLDDVAAGCGISSPGIGNILRGDSLPNTASIVNIADYFCVPVDYLFGRCELDEFYTLDMHTVVERSYEKYLGTNKSAVTRTFSYGGVDAVWPYNLLDAILKLETGEDPDPEVLRYPISLDQLTGLKMVIEDALTDREKSCVRCIFREYMTLEETGRCFNVGRERIRQIVAKAVRKLRHPSRFNVIRYGVRYLDDNDQIKAKRTEMVLLRSKLDMEILELNKKIAEVASQNELSKDDLMDALEISDDRVTEARENIYCLPIDDLDLSVRSYNCLARKGLRTVADVIGVVEDGSIVKIRNLGRRSAAEIATKLIEIGYDSENCRALVNLCSKEKMVG